LEPRERGAHGTDLKEDPSAGFVQRLEQEQVIRDGINKLSPRCKQVIEALFFEEADAKLWRLAARLGLSANSIGFTRDRSWSVWDICGDLGYAVLDFFATYFPSPPKSNHLIKLEGPQMVG